MPETPETMLLQFLADREEPCPRCGYNLLQLTRKQCPECGSSLELRVGLVEPRWGAYIATLIGAGLGIGGPGMFTTLALFHAPGDWFEELVAWILLTQWAFFTGLLVILLWRRSLLTARPITAQRLFAMATWGLMLVWSGTAIAMFPQ